MSDYLRFISKDVLFVSETIQDNPQTIKDLFRSFMSITTQLININNKYFCLESSLAKAILKNRNKVADQIFDQVQKGMGPGKIVAELLEKKMGVY